MTTEATFSELLRNPTEVVERLARGDVVLTRRGAEPLRLSKDSTVTREHEMVAALAQLIAATVTDDAQIQKVAHALRGPFPWIDLLEDDAAAFVGDFLRTARACASVGRFERLGVEVENWRETAIAYSLGLRERGEELDHMPAAAAPDPMTA